MRKCFFFYNYAKELCAKLINTKNSSSKSSNHKILLIGDSHLRGYSEMMKHHLNNQFQVSGFIKSGADAKTILNHITKEVNNLTANDYIILCCGSNNIGKVKLNMVLNDFIELIKRVTRSNVILLTIPYRHDLKYFNTSLNNEIIIFNKKLLKLKKLFSHLTVIELNANRHLCTKHGVHLNSVGKEILSLTLVLKIFSLIEEKNNLSTNIKELSYHETKTQIISSSENQPFPPIFVANTGKTLTKRIRKKPVTKNNDILWEI
jgi:hypothetical protein